MRENIKTSGWSSTAIKLGFGFLVLAFLIYGLSLLIETYRTKDFVVTNAWYYTDFDETEIKLTYTGSSAVNVSVYHEFYFYGEKMNRTEKCGIMKKGDWYTFGSWGYVTWCEVIYDGDRIKLTFTPKRTTVSESPP